MAKNIKKRSEDYAQWYLDVIKAAKLADSAPLRANVWFSVAELRQSESFTGSRVLPVT